MIDWPFDDPPNFAVYSTRQVMEHGEPILAVYHDRDDGSWQFIGTDDWVEEDLVVLCLEHAVARDPSVRALADLPRGWAATRLHAGGSWERYPMPSEDA